MFQRMLLPLDGSKRADLKLTMVCSVAEGTAMLGSCDLMAMATHGRGGLQRLALRSVTERVLEATRRRLLVVHIPPLGGSFAEGAGHNQIGVRGATKG